MNRLLYGLATLWGVGRIPKAPGTAATLVTLVAIAALRMPVWAHAVALVAVTAIGVIASESAERSIGRKDPSEVVIDEAAGIMVATLGLPQSAFYYAGAFVLFRIFDILKPPPVNMLQRIKGGWGVMLDDILAGMAANAILQAWQLWR